MPEDNLSPETDNLNPEAGSKVADPISAPNAPNEVGFSWKTKLGADLANAPTFQKFEDTPDGLKKAFESHASLEKMLGHEKVPIPKGPEDVEGWTKFSKAMGIPDKAEGYGLADANLPEGMQGMVVDKGKFAEIVHGLKLTPNQAKGLWGVYQKESISSYQQAVGNFKDSMTKVVNQLKSEWGDSYEANVDLGQTVISKFAPDADSQEFITAMMLKDPRSIKFLAAIGNQFAENKVGEFSIKRFSLAPEQAKAEWAAIRQDPKHPYNNEKAPPAERDAAIDYVNKLIKASMTS
jgi:hypothetical protein